MKTLCGGRERRVRRRKEGGRKKTVCVWLTFVRVVLSFAVEKKQVLCEFLLLFLLGSLTLPCG